MRPILPRINYDKAYYCSAHTLEVFASLVRCLDLITVP